MAPVLDGGHRGHFWCHARGIRRPEPYVRKVLVNTYASWWRRQRAVLVLRYTLTELVVNASERGSFEDTSGGGGGWGSGYVIQPGESPTLTFRMARGKVGNTVLGIALSDQVH